MTAVRFNQIAIGPLLAGVFSGRAELQRALDLVAAQAAGAHGHALRGAINRHANLLRVRSPGAARLAVGVADVVAVYDALAANLTILSHTLSHLLQGYVTTNNGIIPPSGPKRKSVGCKTSEIQSKKFPDVKNGGFSEGNSRDLAHFACIIEKKTLYC